MWQTTLSKVFMKQDQLIQELKYTFKETDGSLTRQKSSLKKGAEIARLSSLVVAFIGITKGVVGFYSASVALLAQAADSFTDVFASFSVYVGLKVASRKPTVRFPYGYYKLKPLPH